MVQAFYMFRFLLTTDVQAFYVATQSARLLFELSALEREILVVHKAPFTNMG